MNAELRRALSESEKRNEEINREFQKLLRQKEVIRFCDYKLVLFSVRKQILIIRILIMLFYSKSLSEYHSIYELKS